LGILEGTVATDLSTTATTIDYHLIIGGLIHEIFDDVLIIVGVASAIKLASLSVLAGDSR